MTDYLPTITANGSIVDDLRKSLFDALNASVDDTELSLFYYSASVAGWRLMAPKIVSWRAAKAGRTVRAFVGTDHGFTDPLALGEMMAANVSVRVMTMHSGIYHPKVAMLCGPAEGTVWVGSNNLSESALTKNVEFALKADFAAVIPAPLGDWIAGVEVASEILTPALLKSYESERNAFEKKTSSFTAKKFIWSKRKPPKTLPAAPPTPAATAGALVMEITKRETGTDGKQVQPPLATVGPFFGLPGGAGASRIINIRLKGSPQSHPVTLTRQQHSMARIQIAELDYSHRPGFLVFAKVGQVFEYEIVTQTDEPARYAALRKLATNQTNPTSRRWKVLP